MIRDGAVGPPTGYVPAADGSPDAGYASITLDRPVTTVGADVRWDRSDDVASGLALGAFTHVPGPGSVLGAHGGSPLHLGVAPALVLFSVFSRGIDDYETLTPEGMDPRTQGAVVIPRPLVQDGRTRYRVEAVIDRRASSVSVTVPGLPTLDYRDRRLGEVDARVAFWEFYTVPGSTNVPRFTRMWAD